VRAPHHAAEHLLPLVYEELRRLAAQKLAQEKPGQTLQATALVHEAYLRLVDTEKTPRWNSRGHFFAAAAEAMRLDSLSLVVLNANTKTRKYETTEMSEKRRATMLWFGNTLFFRSFVLSCFGVGT
jgi:hypothetical protein